MDLWKLALADSFFQDHVIDLGSSLGPGVDLTFGYNLVADGSGGFGFDFAVGGAVPETSTWAMVLLGFAGLGFAGYRRAKGHAPRKQAATGCLTFFDNFFPKAEIHEYNGSHVNEGGGRVRCRPAANQPDLWRISARGTAGGEKSCFGFAVTL